MAKEIYKRLGRTVTTIRGKGLISGDKEVLYCVLTRIEIYELRHIAEEMDIDIVDFVKQLDQTILDMVALESIKDRRIRQSLIDKQPLQLDI